MDDSNPQIRKDDDHKISEVEVTSMIPIASLHPTLIALNSLFFIVAGVIWQPYLVFVGLFFVVMLWSESMKWVNWAKGIQHKRDREERIQGCIDEAVSTGKIKETIEELRKMMREIPNGRFTKKTPDFERYQDMDSVIDRLLDYKQ